MTANPEQKPREFYLARGKFDNWKILVDNEDYNFLMRFKWHVRPDKNTAYAHTNVKIGGKNHSVSMHRLISGLPTAQIDHINRNGLDNRKSNLRFCTPQQNQCNRVRENKFGYRGVFKPTGSSKFAIQIQANGKKIARYGFLTAYSAAKAYDKLSKEIHGEFGIRNFKD